jgi:hypothetical protein
MSFSIQAAGRIEDVIEQIKAHDFGGGDTSQAETIRALLLAELEAWADGPYYRGVIIDASGHHDTSQRSLSVSMRPFHIREPKTEAEGGA